MLIYNIKHYRRFKLGESSVFQLQNIHSTGLHNFFGFGVIKWHRDILQGKFPNWIRGRGISLLLETTTN